MIPSQTPHTNRRVAVSFVVKKAAIPIPQSILSLLLSLSFLLSIPYAHAAELAYRNLNDQEIAIEQWPAFIITSQSEDKLSDALRCASFIDSADPKPHWLIDFAWPQSAAIKRRIAAKLLKSDFMKTHSTILEDSISNDSLVALINANREILWSSPSYPSDEDWQIALDILRANRAE